MTQEKDQYYGVVDEQVDSRDWLIADGVNIPRSPRGTDSFLLNGATQYPQYDVAKNSCTVHGAMGAYSDLTGYKFSVDERKEIWQEALNRGADPSVGWYINSAVDLVREWVNKNCPVQVNYYRVMLGSFEHGAVMRLGYSVIGGYRGNKTYNLDRDDGVLDSTEFINTTYGHCLRWNYSKGDEYDRVVDNYPYRNTNLYLLPTANWQELVKNNVFFKFGYIYLIKNA